MGLTVFLASNIAEPRRLSTMILAILCISLVVLGTGLVGRLIKLRHGELFGKVSNLPGPKGLPFVGAVHKLASANPWFTFHNWSKEYGPIYQVNLGGSTHIWISQEEIAIDLLAKRGDIYSDRPHIPALMNDNRTSGHYLPLLSNNEIWRRQRKFAKSIMLASQRDSFFGYPELEAIRMLKELLDSPSDYNTSFESYVARITCRLAWGTAVASDELKQRARELLIGVSPTGSLLNKLPFLMLLPDWLSPVKAWERRRTRTERVFFASMQEQVKAYQPQYESDGEYFNSDFKTFSPSSYHGSCWTDLFLSPYLRAKYEIQSDLEGAYAVGMHGIAGALTIAAPMQSFCLAICLYPKYLPELHAELDLVCGSSPPKLADLPKLPFLRACIRETLRWRPPVPTGIPHRLTQDDFYNGYHLPKGAIIHPLEWSMSRNPMKYPQPDAWNPHRWLDPSFPTFVSPLTKHPTITGFTQFGFGRRVCQGQEVAEADLFVGIGTIAWAFDLRKRVDLDTGIEIPVPQLDYSSLLIAKPRWFDFELSIRSIERREWIEAAWRDAAASGDMLPARRYWDEKNPLLGWGKV